MVSYDETTKLDFWFRGYRKSRGNAPRPSNPKNNVCNGLQHPLQVCCWCFFFTFFHKKYICEQYLIIIINYRYSGLVSKIIFGVAKGMDYKPGNTFTPGSNHHTWNAVLLNGVWELVDTRFAKRPVLAGATGGPSMQYEFDDHFFMTNPQKFIYTHFPDESKWQMLDPLVTMETFCNMPVMTPHFFALNPFTQDQH